MQSELALIIIIIIVMTRIMHNLVILIVVIHGLFPIDSTLPWFTGSTKINYKLHLKCLNKGVLLHGHLPLSLCKTLRTATSQTTHIHSYVHTWQQHNLLPAQHPQNEIENEKGAEDDERDKIDPWQLIAHSILHLRERRDRGEEEKEKQRGLTGKELVGWRRQER